MVNKRRKRPIRNAHPVRFPFIIAVLCGVIVLTVAIITSKAPVASSKKNVIGSNRPNNSICTSHCQSSPNTWIPLKSEASADVISAAKRTQTYQIFTQQSNNLAPNSASTHGTDPVALVFKTGTLGTPVLVKPYRDDIGSLTYWVIPLLNHTKKLFMMLTFIYDPVHHQLRASDFGGGNDFTASHSFPSVSQVAAITLVQHTEHVSAVLKGSKAPALIYFEFNPFVLSRAGLVHWVGGGTANSDPIWRIATTDGHYYYVDHLGKRVYTGKNLPIDPSYPPAL